MTTRTRLKTVMPLVSDVVAPVVVFYALHALGVHDAAALAISALLPGVSTGTKLVRQRKLDQLGLFMTALFLLGVALVFVTGNPRLLLIKPALFVGLAAVFCYASLLRKPFMMTIAKPMATEGDARLQALWEQAWRDSPAFQATIRRSTVVFGTALAVDAIGRIIIVYTTPVDTAVALANLPGIIALAGAIIFHLRTVKPVFERLKRAP